MSIETAQPYRRRPRTTEGRKEMHDKKNKEWAALYKDGHCKHKPVVVRFPDVDLPIEISLAEWGRYKKDYFALGAEIVVKGERLVEQLELSL